MKMEVVIHVKDQETAEALINHLICDEFCHLSPPFLIEVRGKQKTEFPSIDRD